LIFSLLQTVFPVQKTERSVTQSNCVQRSSLPSLPWTASQKVVARQPPELGQSLINEQREYHPVACTDEVMFSSALVSLFVSSTFTRFGGKVAIGGNPDHITRGYW